MLLIFLISVGLILFLVFLAPEHPTHRIVGTNSAMVLYSRPNPSDSGLRELVLELEKRMNQRQEEDLPDWLRPLVRSGSQQEGSLLSLLPSELTLINEGGHRQVGLAANGGAYLRIMRAVFLFGNGYRGARCLPNRAGAVTGFYGGTLVWARSEEMFRRIVDRLVAAAESPPPSASHLKGAYDLFVLLRPDAPLWQEWGLPGASAEVGVDIVSADEALLEVYSPSTLGGDEKAIRRQLDLLSQRMAERNLKVSWSVTKDSGGLRIIGQVAGLRSLVRRFLVGL